MLPDYTERIRRRLLLFTVLVILGFFFYTLYRHDRNKVRPSNQLKEGLKVLTDPESVVKDL